MDGSIVNCRITSYNVCYTKLLRGRVVLEGQPRDYREADGAGESPLATALFAIPGVLGVGT